MPETSVEPPSKPRESEPSDVVTETMRAEGPSEFHDEEADPLEARSEAVPGSQEDVPSGEDAVDLTESQAPLDDEAESVTPGDDEAPAARYAENPPEAARQRNHGQTPDVDDRESRGNGRTTSPENVSGPRDVPGDDADPQTFNFYTQVIQGLAATRRVPEDPTKPLELPSPSPRGYSFASRDLGAWADRLLRDHMLLLWSEDPDAAWDCAMALAGGPDFAVGCWKRHLPPLETGSESVRIVDFESLKIVTATSAEKRRGEMTLIVAEQHEPLVRSAVAVRRQIRHTTRMLADRKVFLLITASPRALQDNEGVEEVGVRLGVEPLFRRFVPDKWEEMVEEFRGQRERGLWTQEGKSLLRTLVGHGKRGELRQILESLRGTTSAALRRSRREAVGLDRLGSPSGRLQTVVHFVAAFVPDVRFRDLAGLVEILLGDDERPARHEMEEGHGWTEAAKPWREIWREERQSALEACRLEVERPGTSSRQRGGGTDPFVSYRDPEVGADIRDFFSGTGHGIFLELVDRIDVEELIAASTWPGGLEHLLAECAEMYPERALPWLEAACRGTRASGRCGPIGDIAEAFLQRKRTAESVYQLMHKLDSRADRKIRNRLFRRLRFVDSFEVLRLHRAALQEAFIVPARKPGDSGASQSNAAREKAASAAQEIVEWACESRTDVSSLVDGLLHWVRRGDRDPLGENASRVLLKLSLCLTLVVPREAEWPPTSHAAIVALYLGASDGLPTRWAQALFAELREPEVQPRLLERIRGLLSEKTGKSSLETRLLLQKIDLHHFVRHWIYGPELEELWEKATIKDKVSATAASWLEELAKKPEENQPWLRPALVVADWACHLIDPDVECQESRAVFESVMDGVVEILDPLEEAWLRRQWILLRTALRRARMDLKLLRAEIEPGERGRVEDVLTVLDRRIDVLRRLRFSSRARRSERISKTRRSP